MIEIKKRFFLKKTKLGSLFSMGFMLVASMMITLSCAKGEKTGPDDQRRPVDTSETIAVAKADSIVVHGGNERIEITWRLQSDANVHSYKVSWYRNNKSDFIEKEIQKANGRHVLHVMFDKMEEGDYYFEIRMYDEQGNVSPKATVTGKVYGSSYRSSLQKCTFSNIKRIGDDIEVRGLPTPDNFIGVEVRYQNANGDSIVHFTPVASGLDTIEGLPTNQPFRYRSAYLPEPTAIDTFYSGYLTAQIGSEYKVEEHYDSLSETGYFLTRINHKDGSGKIIKLRLAMTDESKPMGETATEFASRMGATLVFNASMSTVISTPSEEKRRVPVGIQIIDGKIVQERPTTKRYFLGIKDNNKLVTYARGTTAQDILDDGTHNALTAFIPLIMNHEAVPDNILDIVANSDDKHPRQVIAQFDNLDILFLTCGGRGYGGKGMTAPELIRILKGLGVRFAYNLDGGGSISTVAEGNFINWKIDGHGTEERLRANFLYVQ